ncbi:MAG: hypothetical protein R3F62_18100 [Planctomycetota bacterium]
MPQPDDPAPKKPGLSPPPPAPQVPTNLDLHLRCTYCHDALVSNAGLHCGACLAPHHPECVQTHGACAAPGCGGKRFVRPEPLTVTSAASGPRWGRVAALLLVGLGLALGGQQLAFEADAPPPDVPAPAASPLAAPAADLPATYRGISRVLYVDVLGTDRAERVVKALGTDPTVALTVRGRAAGGSPEPLLLPRPTDFDVVVLGPLQREPELHALWLLELRSAVRSHGVGLVLAGELSAELEHSELSGLLPVEVAPEGVRGDAWRLRLTAAGRRAPVLQVAPTWERSWEAWAALPQLSGHAGARRARAETEVLAVASGDDPAPVLALATRGEGQVLWVGFDLAQPWSDDALHAFLRTALHALTRPAPEVSHAAEALVTTRSWRLKGSVRSLASDLASYGDAPVAVDPRVEGEVNLELASATWLEALREAARAVGAGVVSEPAGGYLVTPAAADWPFVVVESTTPTEPASPLPPSDVPLDAMIAAGQAYLLKEQKSDGTWSGDGASGASALATLALLADPAPSREVRAALSAARPWVRGCWALREEGARIVLAFESEEQWRRMGYTPVPRDPDPPRARHLSYTLAAWAAIELCARYPDDAKLRDATGRYLERLLVLRGSEGGWQLDVELRPNSLSTAFAVTALDAALTRETPIEEPFRLERARQAGRRFLTALFQPPRGAGYAAPGDGVTLTWHHPDEAPGVPLLLAAVVGGLTRSGSSPDLTELQAARLHLYGVPLDPSAHEPLFALLVARELDGSDAAQRWAEDLIAVLAALRSIPDWGDSTTHWPSAGLCGSLYGRVGTTAVAVLCLEAIRQNRR